MAPLYPPRVREPESMDGGEEVSAYASAAAARHLARLDRRFVGRLLARFRVRRLLDVGCGPATIPDLFSRSRQDTGVVVTDISLPMLRLARQHVRRTVASSAARLPFPDGSFDLVLANSLLHHLARPVEALAEMKRLVDRGGHLYLRDLRRPPAALMETHLRFVGRHYNGAMRRLFEASVRASYTPEEARRLAREAGLRGAWVRREGISYLTLQWRRG